jgi:endo-1,4-beta-D-glucanase Y
MGLDPGGPADTAGVGSCTKPSGPAVGGKYLVSAYNQWKQNFIVNGTVVRPENGNDTVSEGIAYGMLIAVNMNDKTTFDTLYSYWKSHASAGTLMTWCLPNGGNSCNAQGGGSATDADEDAAFALLQAGKVWAGGTYTADAKAMIADIWSKDIDPSSHLPTGGSNYGSTSSKPTNPSYFAPSHYRAFKAAGDTNNWDAVISAVYGVINGSMSGANGLFPAWCSGNCTAVASNGGMNDTIYQYDAHRIPMRIGMDYCWNGATAAAAQTYANKIAGFFATNPAAGLNGIGRIFDLYSLNGNAASGGGPNSASIIGTAAVAAMASGQKTFLNDAYQAVFDMVTRGTLAPPGTAGTPYSYYNATVGMLTLLIMTGNFMH